MINTGSPCETLGVLIPMVTSDYLFLLHCFFFSQETFYRKVPLVNHSFNSQVLHGLNFCSWLISNFMENGACEYAEGNRTHPLQNQNIMYNCLAFLNKNI